MTDRQRLEAGQEAADAALRKAKQQSRIASQLAERWRRARDDNNFRQMIRELGGEAR